MRTIWKFKMCVADVVSLDLPRSAKILSMQHVGGDGVGTITLWALVDMQLIEVAERHKFAIVGTGHAVPDYAKDYIATVQCGEFVWHVWSMEP